jgi:probable HAF family extracellular repeat protein
MKTRWFQLCRQVGFAFVAAFSVLAHAEPAYTIIDVGTLGGTQSTAYGINNNGQVTGWASLANTNTGNAFIYDIKSGTMTNLGALGDSGSFGHAINNSGQVAGYSVFSTDGATRAFLYSDGVMVNLGNLGSGSSRGFGINDHGHVVGVTEPLASNSSYFLFKDGKMNALDFGGSGALGPVINANGQIAGTTPVGVAAHPHAILYSNGVKYDLGTFGGLRSQAYAINASGQVTGYANPTNSNNTRAFLYSGSVLTNLGTLGSGVDSYGFGINSAGEVVGASDLVAGDGTQHAFLYSTGKMVDLNDLVPAGSGWVLNVATSINDAGQIAGYGTRNGKTRAFVLNPTSVAVTLSPTGLSLTEGGAAGTYTAVLTRAPIANVVVTVSPNQQLSTSTTQLTFTPANWNTPQTVSVQAIQDGVAEGAHTGIISHTSASSDTRYNGLSVSNMTVAITDTIAPTITQPVPAGTVWTQTSLPVTGTAAPGATVILSATHLSTGDVRAVSTVAAANGAWSTTLTGLTDGSHELQADASGIKSNKVTVAVDSNAPVSTLSMTSSNGPTASGWYNGPINFTISATDGTGGQGVARSEYTLDGGALTTFPAGTLTVSADGNHTMCYRSVDTAGNAEAMRCVPASIDATAPTVNPVFDAATNILNLNAQDGVSGLASVEISRDGGATWTAQSGPVGFTRDGAQVVHYRVRDVAENLTAGQTTVTVVTIPVITAPADQNAAEAASQSFSLGSFSDQAADAPWNIDVDWGDGSAHAIFTLTAPGALGTLPHTYADNGT